MATFPKIFGGVGFAQFPVTRQIVFDTRIDVAPNGSEQRFVNNVPLFRFNFVYNSLLAVDESSLLAFFTAQGGELQSNWSAALGSPTYANLSFEQDAVSFVQNDPLLWGVTLQFRQTQNLGFTLPSPALSFPNLSSGRSFQRPYSATWRNLTVAGDSQTGTRYSYGFYGTGVTGFPTRQLRSWQLSYPVLSDTDSAIIEGFFLGQQGRYGTFALTDDAGNTYSNCRLDSDVLELRYNGPNNTSCGLTVKEFFV